jgi:NAD(P)-dependent dehydrogenase (short-subunit alcohol dehydrogenase family)
MTYITRSYEHLFESKIAVVTGGAGGIGLAAVKKLLDLGAYVYILDQLPIEIDSDKAQVIQCDLTSEVSVKDAFAEISKRASNIDIVCANAGIVPQWSATADIDLDTWNKVFAINSTGLMLTIKHSIPLMTKDSGSIVVSASINSWKADPNIAAYVASKHAALGIIRSTAMDLGSKGIRVNGVGPGPIATTALLSRISDRAGKSSSSSEEILQKLANLTALKRIATIDDVVNTIIFLASDSSAGITGQLIPVDCGVF